MTKWKRGIGHFAPANDYDPEHSSAGTKINMAQCGINAILPTAAEPSSILDVVLTLASLTRIAQVVYNTTSLNVLAACTNFVIMATTTKTAIGPSTLARFVNTILGVDCRCKERTNNAAGSFHKQGSPGCPTCGQVEPVSQSGSPIKQPTTEFQGPPNQVRSGGR